MTKLIVTLRENVNAPKQHSVSRKLNFFFTSGTATNAGRDLLIIEVYKSHTAMHHGW